MSVILIVQARGGSSRFPNKVLRKIKNYPMIILLLKRLKYCKKINHIIVATSKHKTSDKLNKVLKKNNFNFFRGSENNVIKRFIDIGKIYNPKYIVRVTGDCPFVNANLIDKYVTYAKKYNYDYVSNVINRSYPKGIDLEIFKFSILKDIYLTDKSKETKEHVTPKIIKSKKYKKYNFQLTNDYSKYNLSVDYRKDLNFVKKVYNLYGEFNFSITKLIKIVKQLH